MVNDAGRVVETDLEMGRTGRDGYIERNILFVITCGQCALKRVPKSFHISDHPYLGWCSFQDAV
jgi:hypothetical protein